MDKIIAKTIELAHELMEDSRFLDYRLAHQANDSDIELQNLIGEFNINRMNLHHEMSKEADETSEEKIKGLEAEMRKAYDAVMENETMNRYKETKETLDALLGQINKILVGTVNGDLPEEVDLTECEGGCESCGGGCGHEH